jgi:hypothetical protein
MSLRRASYFAATMAGIAASIYFLIALRVITVLEHAPKDQAVFGAMAGSGYAIGVVLLLASERRVVWVLGALLQVFVIAMYFSVSPDRTPHYEVWGILLRIPQSLILITLVYLSIWGKSSDKQARLARAKRMGEG